MRKFPYPDFDLSNTFTQHVNINIGIGMMPMEKPSIRCSTAENMQGTQHFENWGVFFVAHRMKIKFNASTLFTSQNILYVFSVTL